MTLIQCAGIDWFHFFSPEKMMPVQNCSLFGRCSFANETLLVAYQWLGRPMAPSWCTLAHSHSTSVPFEWCKWSTKFPQGLQVPLLILLEFCKLEQGVLLCKERLLYVGSLLILKAWNWSGRLWRLLFLKQRTLPLFHWLLHHLLFTHGFLLWDKQTLPFHGPWWRGEQLKCERIKS